MIKKLSSALSVCVLLQAGAQASETIEYQQGVNEYSGNTSTTFSSSRAQNPTRTTHYFRYSGKQRIYNIEHFELGDLSQKGAVESAKLVLYHVGGYSYKESDIYVRRILDPDNLGGQYATGWEVGHGFRAGANIESRDDSGSVDVKWRLSDPDSPDDLNADYFQGVLKSIQESPYYTSAKGAQKGDSYEVDVTADLQCIQTMQCPNQGWALYHQEDDANIQNTTATSNHEDLEYRPKLVVTYAPYVDTLEPLVIRSAPNDELIQSSDNNINLTLTTNEGASCRFDRSPVISFDDMRYSMSTNNGINHSGEWKAPKFDTRSHLYGRCIDETANETQTPHVFTFTTEYVEPVDNEDPGSGGNNGGGTYEDPNTDYEPSDLLNGLNNEEVWKTLYATIGEDLSITLGQKLGLDGNAIAYQVTGSPSCASSVSSNSCIYNSSNQTTDLLTVSFSDSGNDKSYKIIVVNQPSNSGASSNFVQSKDLIPASYGNAPIAKGETHTDPVTGAKITRLTDASMIDSDDALIVYSRYSPENSTGNYFLIFGKNSASSWVVERETGNIITELTSAAGTSIGENNEVRWDTSGRHPNRIYFIKGMKFWMIDDVTNKTETTKLIKDFSEQFPNSVKIYNDVEGDSSNDSDHWAWMAVHYGSNYKGSQTYLVDAFIHYQVSTDETHSLTPSDLAGTNLDIEKDKTTFTYRPNMIEMSPLGTGVVIHMGRKWDDVDYGGIGINYIDTWFDGPHLWPNDFNFQEQTPTKISVSETHSGWSFDEEEREMFISQNNRTDRLDAIYIDGENSGYDNRVEVASHRDFGWEMSFHYGKMPQSIPGWLFMNTYSKRDDYWAGNQFMMIQIKPEEEDPIIWRISPAYNKYDGDYRDEAPAAINLSGNRIYWSSNWGGQLDHREVFIIELPDNWDSELLN
ncbi:hypothetical protein [Litoribacillus peritrichatus]|uniref:Uncharacterized protein n=1 Tax=Litoribacillus peritrichatus TaxID=718191 RepID=A0ABP7M9G2_9GAMM